MRGSPGHRNAIRRAGRSPHRDPCGYDLNGDGAEDALVGDFRYRDGFDGFEKEFRGFAFAQRTDYGDDFLWDGATGLIPASGGWDRGATPTGQVPGPSLVTRYRFHTGAADQQDNDVALEPPFFGYIDEFTESGGREEECLKGKQLLEEKIDPWVLHSSESDFDTACAAAAAGSLYASITADAYVYQRARQYWGVRRLYRPLEDLPLWDDSDGDGILTALGTVPLYPPGRFASVSVSNGDGRSVSFAFVQKIETDVFEANGLLSAALGYPERGALTTRKDYDFDDYGNATLELDHGIIGGGYDDERKTITNFALDGQALERWIINQPATINTTDENGIFVNRTVNHYDGAPYQGLPAGQIGGRALLHRVQQFVDPGTAIDASRSAYDGVGNVVVMRDPNHGTPDGTPGGNERFIAYDEALNLYPVTETIKVGGDMPDLVITASYDLGFGVVTSSTDFNGHRTSYDYDSFARLVAITKPGDSLDLPTLTYQYQPFDPNRSQRYTYAKDGSLAIENGGIGASRVISHAREKAGTANVYTTASYTDGCGKTLAEIGEGEDAGTWIVSKASSYNLRGGPSKTWLPYQVSSADIPPFGTLWPNGRPPASDGINPSVVESTSTTDPLGREIHTLQPLKPGAASAPSRAPCISPLRSASTMRKTTTVPPSISTHLSSTTKTASAA
ncbi:MAG: hypothetical protein R3F19_06295 [Verrucomicrobiales bacterium]